MPELRAENSAQGFIILAEFVHFVANKSSLGENDQVLALVLKNPFDIVCTLFQILVW
jgi:hypothetical protein